MTISVIGAGNGGQSLAAHLASKGHRVRLYDRDKSRTVELNKERAITLTGALNLIGYIDFATNNIGKAIEGAEIIMVVTTATAHKPIASQIAPLLKDGQMIILNPGRTGGALEFKNTLLECGVVGNIKVAEAQTLIYACRLIENGKVNVIGVKDKVLISAYPSSDTSVVINRLKPILPCLYPAKNVLQTGFENVGAMFHPVVVLFNAAAIERGENFYFYRDMTDGLANIINEIDKERLTVASAYGISPISAFDWVSYAYDGVDGKDLCERMQNNPAYYEILAPTSINCRQITEDIPTGIVPMAELGRVAGVPTPMFDALITMTSTLLKTDLRECGRTLANLGLEGLTKQQIIDKMK